MNRRVSHYSLVTARMPTLAFNGDNSLLRRIFALRAAIIRILIDRAAARFVFAFVGFCHSFKTPSSRSEFTVDDFINNPGQQLNCSVFDDQHTTNF